MLQLPQRSSAKFTRTDIAEIARGAATVKQRSKPRRPKSDPIIKLVDRYRAAVERYKEALSDLKMFYASHDPAEVKPAAVYLSPSAMLTIHDSIDNREFFYNHEIERWANGARKYYRAILRGQRKDWEAKTISRAAAKARIADVDELEPQLKRALRSQSKIVKQRWIKSGYQTLIDRRHRTFWTMIRLRNSLRDAQATSFAGVSVIFSLLQEQAWDEVRKTHIDAAMPPNCRKLVLMRLEKALIKLAPERPQ